MNGVDAEPDWVTVLRARGPDRDEALALLHVRLVGIARAEVRRRGVTLRLAGPELDDIADQAADDALMAITLKLDQFRGESRFSTWAYSFVILEVSTKLGRHFWRRPGVTMDMADWERLPDRLAMGPADVAQHRDLLVALRSVVDEELTARQRDGLHRGRRCGYAARCTGAGAGDQPQRPVQDDVRRAT